MNGFLCLNKPAGITSRDAVNRIQRQIKPAKVGHAGTLDPIASGVLVLAIGKATRLVPYVQRMAKQYRATFELGKTSDTEDITGSVKTCGDVSPPEAASVRAACQQFVGEIQQRPPIFSALHVNGKRAYDLARRGEAVELTPRTIVVHSIQLIEYSFPHLKIDVSCGSGTYIRSLGRDIGALLACGAVMADLQRTSIGSFHIENSKLPDELPDRASITDWLMPPLVGVEALSRVTVDSKEIEAISYGQRITLDATGTEVAAVSSDGQLVAVLTRKSNQYGPAINLVAK